MIRFTSKHIYRHIRMLSVDTTVESELLLQDGDFPGNYKRMAHPNDYEIIKAPIDTEFIFHKNQHHNRLIMRISWMLGDNRYVPMSFVCDTGAPMFFYLDTRAIDILRTHSVITEDELQTLYVTTNGHKALVQETPATHKPANIIGLLMLSRFGLTLENDRFKINKHIRYL